MENRSSFTIVGIFAAICIAAMLSFVWWLTTRAGGDSEYKTYYIHTKELPAGLKENAQVKYIGVPAGFVSDITFADGSNYGTIEIALKLDATFPIKKDSIAKTEVQGLGGLVSLNITKGTGEGFASDEKPIIYLDKGLLAKLNSKAGDITEGINDAVSRVNSLLSDENIDSLSATLKSIESLASKLSDDEIFDKVDSILASVDSMLGSADDNKSEFSKLMANVDVLINSMDKFTKTSTQTSAKFSKTLDKINASLASGEYNLKEILGPTLHETSLSLVELKKSLREFQKAMFRLEDDPYDFFFRDTSRGEKR